MIKRKRNYGVASPPPLLSHFEKAVLVCAFSALGVSISSFTSEFKDLERSQPVEKPQPVGKSQPFSIKIEDIPGIKEACP